MSVGCSEAAAEPEPGEEIFSALAYESGKGTKLKKKVSRRPAKLPRSPYTSTTCLLSKRAGLLRSFKGTDCKHFDISLVKASRQRWHGSHKQGTLIQQSKSDLGIDPAFSSLPGSTPEYLKEALGMKKPKHTRSAGHGYIPGTPDYKEKEDMYDEIIELKKKIQAQKCEADRMKTKLRRLEEENNRKDKQIEQLLDPFRGSECSWIRTEQKNESSSVINGLKQKILRLEQQCKEKDNTINQLQAEAKRTDMEEMAIALQTCYEEIQRLQALLTKSKAVQRKSAESKQQEALHAAVLQLTKGMKKLHSQNGKLKADLDHFLSTFPASGPTKSPTNWSRQKLARLLAEWEEVSDEGRRATSEKSVASRAFDDSPLPQKMNESQINGLQVSEASRALLLTPADSEPPDRTVTKELDLPLCKVVEGLAGQREETRLLGEVRKLEESREANCTQARNDVTEPPHPNPASSSESCCLQGVADCKAKEMEASVRLVQSVFRAHVTRAQWAPLDREETSLVASREEKDIWSPFKHSPLAFTSADAALSSRQQMLPSPLAHAEEAQSDDSDEIVTVFSPP